MEEFKGVDMELFNPFKHKDLYLKTKYIDELIQKISIIILDLRYKNVDEYDLLLLQIAYTKSVPIFAIDPKHQIQYTNICYSACLIDLLSDLHRFMGV